MFFIESRRAERGVGKNRYVRRHSETPFALLLASWGAGSRGGWGGSGVTVQHIVSRHGHAMRGGHGGLTHQVGKHVNPGGVVHGARCAE